MPYYVQNFKYEDISQTYHRKYSKHNHTEATKFSKDAKADFMKTNKAPSDKVEELRSCTSPYKL